jgi:hypothetical protein
VVATHAGVAQATAAAERELPPVLAPLEMGAMHRWTVLDWVHYKLLRYSVELVLVGTLVAGTAPRDVAHAGYVLLSLLFLRQVPPPPRHAHHVLIRASEATH